MWRACSFKYSIDLLLWSLRPRRESAMLAIMYRLDGMETRWFLKTHIPSKVRAKTNDETMSH